MSIDEKYPYLLEASTNDWKSYYNSRHYLMSSKPYNGTRYATTEAATRDMEYVKSNYDDSITVQVVLYKDAMKYYNETYK